MTIKQTITACICAIILSACSTGQPLSVSPQSVGGQALLTEFKAIDVDGDGKIPIDQTTTYHETLFKQSDANADGNLEPSEIPAIIVPPNSTPKLVLTRLDRDGNGSLTAREFLIRVNTLHSRDQNGDGSLTAEEFLSAPVRGPSNAPSGGKPSSTTQKRGS